LPTKREKTIQGISDTKENTSPNIPAVDGISIKKPDTNPQIAVALLNVELSSMIREIISNATAFSI
jgi:hypothetical protein